MEIAEPDQTADGDFEGIDYTVSEGDIIEIGVPRAYSTEVDGKRLHITGVHATPSIEYVVLNRRFTHGDTVEMPDDSMIIEVNSGSGMANAIVWYVCPLSAYEGGDE